MRESNNSHKQRQQGREGKYRRTPPYASATPKGTKALSNRGIVFPARATCPTCHRLMEIDPQVLDVIAPLH